MAARKTAPVPAWKQRLAQARTPAEELEASYDRLKAAIAKLSRRQRDPVEMRRSAELAVSLARDAAAGLAYLAQLADDYQPERVIERERR